MEYIRIKFSISNGVAIVGASTRNMVSSSWWTMAEKWGRHLD